MPKTATPSKKSPQHIAIIGAGMAGITAARTLLQAGYQVTVLDKSRGAGGRMSTRRTEFGGFDHGAQYFTVRDARFRQMMQWALENEPNLARPWAANAVRVLDSQGRTLEAALPSREPHWVAQPGMNALVSSMAAPLLANKQLLLGQQVRLISRNASGQYSLQCHNPQDEQAKPVQIGGFDAVLLAIPNVQAHALLQDSAQSMLSITEHSAQILCRQMTDFAQKISAVTVSPCWTLMLAFPNALPLNPNEPVRPLGPQWNAARSTHHRIAWLARESSKPARSGIERWTAQASAAWSQEHLEDDAERVKAKLLKAFAEITHIRAEPAYAQVHRWRYAKTDKALGTSHLWDAATGIGLCGDWCIGHRVEDAFVSGLELALQMIKK
ncbi:FAD-dependent oxidoreductase [Variovorax sp. PCZ-1]|uniref:NAD(P)/FAD-dependent oxidoreductase n=1 Tax=Variovorax sp. PCZ-1 TaxID=2835533 RepID=UPI001BCF8578|nr:FAD-dependent oxidoreductase [Variovorax sp. PCZ-1]MBS7807559.1 FAD-dependent oxidoreductase [Variovorax sp. PCZ-1]